jgi:predicted N-acetyltransferase YhbS
MLHSVQGLVIRRADGRQSMAARGITARRAGWTDHWDTGDVWIAESGDRIVATAREAVIGRRRIHVVGSVWVRDDLRGIKLGQRLMREIIAASTAGILWLDCRPGLGPYYSEVGFLEDDRTKVMPDFIDGTDPPDQLVMSLCR